MYFLSRNTNLARKLDQYQYLHFNLKNSDFLEQL